MKERRQAIKRKGKKEGGRQEGCIVLFSPGRGKIEVKGR